MVYIACQFWFFLERWSWNVWSSMLPKLTGTSSRAHLTWSWSGIGWCSQSGCPGILAALFRSIQRSRSGMVQVPLAIGLMALEGKHPLQVLFQDGSLAQQCLLPLKEGWCQEGQSFRESRQKMRQVSQQKTRKQQAASSNLPTTNNKQQKTASNKQPAKSNKQHTTNN